MKKHAGHSSIARGCYAVGKNALHPCAELWVWHHIKTMITSTLSLIFKNMTATFSNILVVLYPDPTMSVSPRLALHSSVLAGPALSSLITFQICHKTATMSQPMVGGFFSHRETSSLKKYESSHNWTLQSISPSSCYLCCWYPEIKCN
jgi:hypothetical protein